MKDDQPGGPIRWKLHLPVPREKVYEALDTAQGRASFWAESAEEENGVISFHFINGITTQSKILAKEPSTLWEIEYFGSIARFELTAAP